MALFFFWVSIACLLYGFVVYPVSMLVVGYLFPERLSANGSNQPLPTVTVIIAACNEVSHIRAGVQSLSSGEYPDEKLEIVVVTDDGSIDGTIPLVEEMAREGAIRHLHSPELGKNACLDYAVERCESDVLVFKDAAGEFAPQTLVRLLSHFANERIGCVAGNVIFRENGKIGAYEKSYWRIEQRIRDGTQKLGYLPSAAGGIHALRRSLYRAVGNDVTRDMVDPIQAVAGGLFAIKDDSAVCYERPWEGVVNVYRNRIRVTKRAWAAIRYNVALLMQHGRWGILILLFSHKVFRFLCWVPLAMLFVSSWFLSDRHPLFLVVGVVQLCGYLLALLGMRLAVHRSKPRWLSFPGFLLLNVVAFADATLRYLFGGRAVLWKTG